MKKSKTMRRCEIVSRLTDDDGKILFDIDKLKSTIEERACIKEYCYIIHNKCTYTADELKENSVHKEGALKPSHIHLLLKFDTPQQVKYIAKWFFISENFVNRILGRWGDALLYLPHRNAPDKYQYDIQDVVANFDYPKTVDDIGNQPSIGEIIDRILNGEIREYNKTIEIDNIVLVTYARQINEAFKVRAEYLQATLKNRQTDIIFITGGAGCGKTTLAKQIAQNQGLDYFISSGSNDVMDGYSQEPCLIIDDIRPSVLGLSDLLKLLDPHTVSSVKSRYKNKFLNAELIILTTVLDIDTFYSNVFTSENEPINQLKRRCKTYIKVSVDHISVQQWDVKLMNYTKPITYENSILDEYIPDKELTTADVENHANNLLPFLKKSIFNLVPATEKHYR